MRQTKSGVHALYCEGACPHALGYTCRQFGTVEVQKELSRDIPKVKAKLTAFSRITKDMQRGAIPQEDARRAKDYVRDLLYDIRYNTHFLGVHDLVPEDYDGDPFERLMPGKFSAPAEKIVYRKVCVELLREMFDALPKKDRDILGKCYGVFGFEQTELKEIGMYHMMKESAVIKAKDRAIKKLEKAYPGSKLQLWKTVHRIMRRPILPPDDDTELRTQFPRYVHVLAEVYGVLSTETRYVDENNRNH